MKLPIFIFEAYDDDNDINGSMICYKSFVIMRLKISSDYMNYTNYMRTFNLSDIKENYNVLVSEKNSFDCLNQFLKKFIHNTFGVNETKANIYDNYDFEIEFNELFAFDQKQSE